MTDKYEGTIWEGVPQPEILIEHVKLAAAGNRRGVSGLRGAISVMKTIPARARCTQFLEFVVRKYSGYQANAGRVGRPSGEDEEEPGRGEDVPRE